VDRFLRHFSPEFGVLMETEVWPNLLAAARRRGVPVMLANARLSARSARGYGRIGALARPAFASLAGVAAQTADDAARLAELGVAPVEICGNLKFDVQPPADKLALGRQWRAVLGERPVWLAASTREGEEELVLQAWCSVAPEALLVLVPRHPQRFAEVAALLGARGIEFARRSEGLPGPASGSGWATAWAKWRPITRWPISPRRRQFAAAGRQNLIEAAACGCPVLVGPHTFNFKQATEDALAAGAALRVADADALGVAVDRLLADETALAGMREAAQSFAQAHQGATGRMLALIADWSGRAAR
jgi:3-deoxy-D-manno-octulosonic-acid transferase